MNRTGDLTKYVIGILIAALCLAIFILAIVRLYDASISREDQNAKAIIDSLLSKAETLEEGQSFNTTIQGFNWNDAWYLVAWNTSDASRPSKCSLQNCVCVCKGAPTGEACQSQHGFCRAQNTASVRVETFPTSARYITSGTYATQVSGVLHAACIVLPKNLMEISITKDQGSLVFQGTPTPATFEAYGKCAPLSQESLNGAHPSR